MAAGEDSRYQEILNYWFGDPQNPTKTQYGEEKAFWWTSPPQLDDEIRNLFENDYEKARRGEYDDWKEEPFSTLALILLFDQIPRNIFRGSPKTYATDHLALATSKMALEKGFDTKLDLIYQKKFMYMPFSHSENLEDQARSVALFKTLGNDGWTAYCQHYYDTIKQYGRFPHRDSILGRH